MLEKDETKTPEVKLPSTSSLPEAGLYNYIHKINSLPVLSREEEYTLANEYIKNGNLEAAQKLVLFNMRYVVHIAKTYSGYGLPVGDLMQEGSMGLMKAVKRFDPRIGVRLISFAVRWIKAEIQEYVIKNWKLVKVATTKSQRKLFFNLRSKKESLGWSTREEVAAIAKDLDVSEADVVEMEARMNSSDVSLYGYDDDSSDNPSSFSPLTYLESPEKDPQKMLIGRDFSAKALKSLRKAITTLDARSQDIIKERWLNEDSKVTLKDLSNKHNVSLERIRQIEKTSLIKVREILQEQDIDITN